MGAQTTESLERFREITERQSERLMQETEARVEAIATVMQEEASLQRLGVGNFESAPQSDGRILVRARFTLDGAPVELDGVANRQNTQLFLKFNARSPAQSWSDGTGTLQGVGTSQLRGFIADAKGAQIALLLKKG